MNSTQLAELKAIADTLAVRSNDPAAMQRFNIWVRSVGPADRRDLVVVLQDMITEARQRRSRDQEFADALRACTGAVQVTVTDGERVSVSPRDDQSKQDGDR
jgi:hypothetical protein